MRHRKSGRKLSRLSSNRKAMFRNMCISLLTHELIKTTLPKAKELRTIIEPLITLAKREFILRKEKDNISSNIFNGKIISLRRQAFSYLRNKDIVKKLFEIIGPRYAMRSGGYIRLLKCGYRFGDKAPVAFVEMINHS